MGLGSRVLRKGELVAVLGEIYQNRETGTLVLQRDEVSKFLYAQDGQLVFAASNATEDKFTEILVEKGKLTPEQLALALEKKEGRTIGRTLVEMGFLASSDLLDALVDQMRRIAFSTANWERGQAVFKTGVLPQNLARLPVTTPRFIIDTALAVEDRDWAATNLGQMEAPLRFSTAEREVARALPLGSMESRLVDAVDGKRNGRQICDMTGQDPFDVARFYIGLLHLGVLHLEQNYEPAPSSSRSRASIDLEFLQKSKDEDAAPAPVPLDLTPAAPLPPAAPEPLAAEEPPPSGGLPFDFEPLAPKAEPAPPPAPKPGKGRVYQPKGTAAKRSMPEVPATTSPAREEPFSSWASSEPARSGRHGIGRWLAWGAAAVVVVGAGLAALWFFFLRPSEYVPMEPPPAVTRPAPELQEPSPSTSATEPPAEAPAPVPAETAPAPAPVPESAAPPVEKPAPKPSEVEPPPMTTAPAPAPQAASPAGEAEARDLLARGRYHEAARVFATVLADRRAAFTIDVEVACQDETITKGLAASGGSADFAVLPYNLKGRDCYRVIWGFYPDRDTAERALAAMPAFFRQNATPRVSTWAKTKPR
jgi:outer membrane biosynthesis protein TonB